MFETLFFTSPFALTASQDSAACWAGRDDVLERIQKLQTSFEHRADSSLDLVWANLGAGKSHLLYHFAYRITSSVANTPKPAVVIVEVPQQLRGFLDLYGNIISRLDLSLVSEQLMEHPPASSAHNLQRAARAIKFGGPQERELAESWLLGGRPHLTTLKSLTGITSRIEEDSAAAAVFQMILQSFAQSNRRFVLMADEFQRLSTMRPQCTESLLSILRSFFSQTPRYFSVLLAAAYRLEQTAIDSLTPELRTLLGPRPSITLPTMDLREAHDFVLKRFAFFRPPGYSGAPSAPFKPEAIPKALQMLEEKGRPLIPREILQGLAYCFDECFTSQDALITTSDVSAAVSSMRSL